MENESFLPGKLVINYRKNDSFITGKMNNLFYNTGHGHLGWTMACGSATITANLIAGRKPEISLEGMMVN